ncbi:hypothetical protein V5O48_013566 [Marasmius crinis-equi]|uniref:Uncharacterized protein n=1 Tax=Marasmius crinis-equi TaxID=585013 RepID=A0ABR3EZU7_9AGAR
MNEQSNDQADSVPALLPAFGDEDIDANGTVFPAFSEGQDTNTVQDKDIDSGNDSDSSSDDSDSDTSMMSSDDSDDEDETLESEDKENLSTTADIGDEDALEPQSDVDTMAIILELAEGMRYMTRDCLEQSRKVFIRLSSRDVIVRFEATGAGASDQPPRNPESDMAHVIKLA